MRNNTEQPSFYFHDYETFGISPAYDKPCQFAGVRTDADLNIIEQPLVIYCQPPSDYLPDPNAVIITGITPQEAMQKGLCEAEFSRQIHQVFSQPNSCIVGYNNIRFDDEVTRNIFYRNFYDPYAYSWQNNNSRWDLLDVVRACYALRPEGINWPLNDKGLVSFRLEHLTQANNIEHTHAHDAMSDVYATIAIAKLIKQAQPRLFDYLFQLRNKRKVSSMIDIIKMTPLVHVSGMFGAVRSNLTIVAPICWHPNNNNAVVVCDLTGDIDTLLSLDSDSLREKLYTKKSDLTDNDSPIPLKLLHINKCPIIAPINTLTSETLQRLQLDLNLAMNKLKQLQNSPLLREKINTLFNHEENFPQPVSVDGALYQGFFNQADKTAIQIIQQTSAENLADLDLTYNDKRIAQLLFQYRARNFPVTLNSLEQQRWQNHCHAYFNENFIRDYFFKIEQLAEQYQHEPAKIKILKALIDYCYKMIN